MEAIATINGVRDGRLRLTVRRAARGGDLQGVYATVAVDGPGGRQRVLCRVGSVDRINPIHDNPAFAPLLMDRGRLAPFSGDCDYEMAEADVIACLDEATRTIEGLRSNPPSGTPVLPLASDELTDFANEREFFGVIGHMPRRPDVPVSVICKDFGDVIDPLYGRRRGGWGEALHAILAGQNGSGKTVLACSLIAMQLAMHKDMGCLIPDTAGDISLHGSHDRGDFKFSLIELLKRAGRGFTQLGIEEIRLESTAVFQKLLAGVLAKALGGIDSGKAQHLSELVVTTLLDPKKPVDPDAASADLVLQTAEAEIIHVYAGKDRGDKQQRVAALRQSPRRADAFADEYERRVCSYFRGRRPISDLVTGFLERGEIILLRLSALSEAEQRFVMEELFRAVKRHAVRKFKAFGERVNGLVVLDEGPTWVGEGSDDPIAEQIKDAYRQTRKYGLGWMVITQRLADISKTVLSEARTKFFGRNLRSGTDLKHIENEVGAEGLALYHRLSREGGFFWLATGEAVNLGSGNAFTAFMTFGGDATAKLMGANPHIWSAAR